MKYLSSPLVWIIIILVSMIAYLVHCNPKKFEAFMEKLTTADGTPPPAGLL
ncbi:MAG: hypothetical protein WC107_04965 [Patescibacteria group bacterium]